MQACLRPRTLLLSVCVLAAPAFTTAHAQAPTQTAPSPQLTSFTAPDRSASAGVPSGWQANGSETVVNLTGPNGETVTLGRTFIARNGAFQPGQKPGGPADLAMPYQTPLGQKLIMVYEQGAALSGKPRPQIAFTSATPLQVPPVLGQCGRFIASLDGLEQPMKIMGLFCSFPMDSAGFYKNVIFVAQAPATIAAQEAPIAKAVIASYRVPQAMLARKLAPVTLPPPPASGPGAGMSSALWGLRQSNIMATCMDEGVIREYGPRQLPRECGGLAPDPGDD